MESNRRLYRREDDGPPNKIENLAHFAVEEHNRQHNSRLRFGKVISVKKQVGSGILYDITLEAVDGHRKGVFEAKVLEKPSMQFKELKQFKPVSHLGF